MQKSVSNRRPKEYLLPAHDILVHISVFEDFVRYAQCVDTVQLQQETSFINYVSIVHHHVGQPHHTPQHFRRVH